MKKILALLGIILSIGYFLSCNENENSSNNRDPTGDDTANINKPPEANISPQKVQQQINSEVHQALSAYNDSIKAEAVIAIAETHDAIRYLLSNNLTDATRAIENALGKVQVITTVNPAMALVPIKMDVVVQDLVTDMQTLKTAKKDIEDLTDKGYLQNARELLEVMLSEMNIRTSSLPLETYPVALKTAVVLAKEGKPGDAALVLNTALNTIVVKERSVPLPLLRAEIMLAAADSLIAAKTIPAEDANLLLDNADYEIRFAEELGYGKRDREFKELRDDIKKLKKEVKDKGAGQQNMISALRSKLKAFKERISPETKK